MAILRAECQGICNKNETRSTYDTIVETIQDLNSSDTETWSIGSMAYVLSKEKVYVKNADAWAPIKADNEESGL